MYVCINSIATGKKELQLTCNHFGKKFLSSRDTRLEGDSIPSQSITQLNGSICCWWGSITSSSRHKAGEETWRCHKKRKWKDKNEKQYIPHIGYQKEKYSTYLVWGWCFLPWRLPRPLGWKHLSTAARWGELKCHWGATSAKHWLVCSWSVGKVVLDVPEAEAAKGGSRSGWVLCPLKGSSCPPTKQEM